MSLDIHFNNILFLDIETVPQYPNYADAPEEYRTLWDKKAIYLKKSDEDTPESLFAKAGIYAEFGKIVCISFGNVYNNKLYIKSFHSAESEIELLSEFEEMLSNFNKKNPQLLLCAHNGKEFDFPYIARRMLINGIYIPTLLDVAGKKPWEVKNLDTMELWKFGDIKHYTSLNLLAYVFNIPSPKDDIDGSMVHEVFYKDKNLQRIVEYCEKDVITIVQLMRRYIYLPLIPASQIEHK
jgi:DNA polymerase elongation subunit (family B)